MRTLLLVLTVVSALGALAACGADQGGIPPAAVGTEFFESKVRPLLADHCWQCHGTKRQESDLRLDSVAAFRKGGASNKPLVDVVNPEQSLLLQVVRRQGELAMPPDEELTNEQLEILKTWVHASAPWPATDTQPTTQADRLIRQRAEHWSLQPITRPNLPAVRQMDWPLTPIDYFVLAELERVGLAPSPSASITTFLRRAQFDLLGLPPSAEEMESYQEKAVAVDDKGRIVERLLASPAYGERWGRHWLDVARYADTRGYAFARDGSYPFAYVYRDYVIRAWNRDLPYDQFVLEQLAADQLDLSEDNSPLAALGFLTVGRHFNNLHEDIDDRIDVVTRGLLGLTVTCARCHDHKYDAISTQDYYGLYGIFASSHEPGELPVVGKNTDLLPVHQSLDELRDVTNAWDSFAQERRAEIVETARSRAGDYLAAVVRSQALAWLDSLPLMVQNRNELRPLMIRRWRDYIKRKGSIDHPVWGIWFTLRDIPAAEFEASLNRLIAEWKKTKPDRINPIVLNAFVNDPPKDMLAVAHRYGDLFQETYRKWKELGANDGAIMGLPDEWRSLAIVLFDPESATELPRDQLEQCLAREDLETYQSLQRKVSEKQAKIPNDLARAMVLNDNAQPSDSPILIRGNPGRPGDLAPRRQIELLRTNDKPITEGSGRLVLAKEIATSNNPLTARVIANRLWLHHFGRPLVETPSDFGVRTQRPRHAELLDYLASRLIESGWSLKSLHREIMTSAVYQQSSDSRKDGMALDAENRLYWRMNRRRLEFEPLHDALLTVAGQLDWRMGGPSRELFRAPHGNRRAVYGRVDRQDLPGLLRTFDFASPDQSTPRRSETTVPQQALFLLNSSFVTNLAKQLAAQLNEDILSDQQEWVKMAYRRVLSRNPDGRECQVATEFLNHCPSTPDGVPTKTLYVQLLMMSNEFLFID